MASRPPTWIRSMLTATITVQLATILLFFTSLSMTGPTLQGQQHNPVTDLTEGRYLLFYPHDGFSNQYFGLVGAMALAAYTNRTLVLPPISPHFSQMEKGSHVPGYRLGYRERRERCSEGFDIVEGDLRAAANGEELPEWGALYDFNDFKGFRVPSFMGFADFATGMSTARDALANVDLLCERMRTMNIKSMSDLGEYESAAIIAYVGSVFEFGSNVLDSEEVPMMPPSRAVIGILKHILLGSDASPLPLDYVGVHIRLPDKTVLLVKGDAAYCSTREFWKAFDRVAGRSDVQLLREYLRDGRVVFLGSPIDNMKRCVTELVKSNGESVAPVIVTIGDVLDALPVVEVMVRRLRVPSSTAALVLDQLVIGLAPDLLTVNMIREHQSTFQRMVGMIHQKRYIDDVAARVWELRKE